MAGGKLLDRGGGDLVRLARRAQAAADVARAHQRILQVGTRVALEVERLVEIEGDHPVGGGLHHEEAQRGDRDLARQDVELGARQLAVALADLLAALGFEPVHQVVGLDPDALAPGHLEDLLRRLSGRGHGGRLLLAVLAGVRRRLLTIAELARGLRRQRDHLVGEVHRALGLGGMAERLEAGAHDPLQVALAGVDDVDDPVGAAEGRVNGLTVGRGGTGLPDLRLLPVAIAEVLAQQPELPELVGDVLADVGHRAVRAHDHLVGVLEPGELLAVRQRHHPAAGVLARRLVAHGAAVLEPLEGPVEKVQGQDVALPRQQVVGDAEPPHGREMAADDAPRHQAAHLGALAAAGLQLVERVAEQPAALAPGVGAALRVVPAPDLGVEVPADVVERLGDRGHLRRPRVPQVEEADHHVGELDAGVVDVVLDLDGVAQAPLAAGEHVAEHGVAQVADVRRLVRVDVGVLDDDLAGALRRRRIGRQQGGGEGGAVEKEVEVAGAQHLDLAHQPRRPQGGREVLGDGTRVALEGARQLHGGRGSEVAQLAARRHLDHRPVGHPEALLDRPRHLARQLVPELGPHGGEESTLWDYETLGLELIPRGGAIWAGRGKA